jgi:RHS repeat-associated protein
MQGRTYGYYANSNKLRQTASAQGNNYEYDAIGNLTKDVAGGVTNIEWTPSGKVRKVTKSSGSPIEFRYDAAGNRVEKKQGTTITRYIRDASGNVMAVYQNNVLTERPIYGSSRLGQLDSASAPGYRRVGLKRYELSNHLGNVLAVVSDRIRMRTDSTWTQVLSRTDYYPFGLEMTGRTESATYRYGFNGKEKDPSGQWSNQTHYDYGFRIYNPAIGKFLSVDPKASKMPSWSPYSFSFNNPIYFIDPDGQEPTPAEAARMAAHVYGDKKDNILTGGWRVSQRDFGVQLQDATGLKSLVYERVVNGKVTEFTYATAGTEILQDWKENGKQPLGLSKQYESSAINAKKISGDLGETELSYVGHSLGGGEAALNSLVTDGDGVGRKAFTFNAAGVGDITKFVEGTWKTPFKSESKIDAYILRTDPLNKLQNSSPIMPDVNGNRHYLWPKDLPSVFNGHSIDNIIKNFGVNPDEHKK